MNNLYGFLIKLEEHNIFYSLNRIRESILVNIVVPGERWEVEFFEDGHIEIERFVTTRELLDERALDLLFERFSD